MFTFSWVFWCLRTRTWRNNAQKNGGEEKKREEKRAYLEVHPLLQVLSQQLSDSLSFISESLAILADFGVEVWPLRLCKILGLLPSFALNLDHFGVGSCSPQASADTEGPRGERGALKRRDPAGGAREGPERRPQKQGRAVRCRLGFGRR